MICGLEHVMAAPVVLVADLDARRVPDTVLHGERLAHHVAELLDVLALRVQCVIVAAEVDGAALHDRGLVVVDGRREARAGESVLARHLPRAVGVPILDVGCVVCRAAGVEG